MEIKEFRKKDLVDLLSVINELTISKTEDDLKRTLVSLQNTVGGDHLIFGIGQSRGFELIGTPKIINVSYPWDWLGVYAEKQLYTDPIERILVFTMG